MRACYTLGPLEVQACQTLGLAGFAAKGEPNLNPKEAIRSHPLAAAMLARELGGRAPGPRPAAAEGPSTRRRRGARDGRGLGLGLLRRDLGGRRERIQLRPRALDRLDRFLRRDRGRLERERQRPLWRLELRDDG